MSRALTGSRIREMRRRRGMSQTALAKAVDISPSYLNLIEHNRRRIGGRILNALAEALAVRPTDLAEGGNPGLLADLGAAAAASPAPVEPPEELAARFPAWADHVARQQRRLSDQEAALAALSDRLSHDPFLAETVHGILSNVTAIRATASILAQMADLPKGQVARFHESLHDESVRLSTTAQDLAGYLSRAGSGAEGAATAEETLDAYLDRAEHHFPDLDAAAETGDGELELLIEARLAEEEGLTEAARALLRRHLEGYAADARAMPLGPFTAAARESACDPMSLARRFGQDLHAVFRRLAAAGRPGTGLPAFGLIVVTASGYPLLRRPLPGFAMPRHGNACPLWPLFRAFAAGGQPILAEIEHDGGETFAALAHAEPRTAPRLGRPADLVSAMLLVRKPESPFPPPPSPPEPVGTSCRICTRDGCAARTLPRLVDR